MQADYRTIFFAILLVVAALLLMRLSQCAMVMFALDSFAGRENGVAGAAFQVRFLE